MLFLSFKSDTFFTVQVHQHKFGKTDRQTFSLTGNAKLEADASSYITLFAVV